MSALCPADWHEERLATVGRLCEADARGIERDAFALIDVYEALIAPRSSGPVQRVSGTPEARVPYSDKRSDAREDIWRRLSSWAALIVDERSVSREWARALDERDAPLNTTVQATAPFIARHWEWLAAHDAAVDCAGELRSLAWGMPRRLAYGGRWARLTDALIYCPATMDDGGLCGHEARAILQGEGARRASMIACLMGHEYAPGEWLALGGEPAAGLDAEAASVALYGDPTWGDSIRAYVSRGRLARGDDGLITAESVFALYMEQRAWRDEA